MRKILFFLLFFSYGIAGITYASWPVSDVSSTSTEAILPTSSGVFTTEYSIKWCTPTYKDYLSVYHQNNLDTDVSNFAKEFCYVGKLMPNGDLPEGGVNPIFTGGVPNLLGALVDGTDFQLKGQGIIDITTTVIDHAGNASTENFTYKIDKSAPEFGGISLLSGIDVVENSQYIHALETETIGGTQVKRNQVHFVDPANIDGILHNPTHASGIASDNAQVRTYTDDFMRKIRYKQTGSDIFDLNFEVDDTWHRAPVTAGFFSGNKNIEIYKAGTTGIIFPVTGTGISLGHGNFSLAPNTGQVYIARAYDNAGNFTEEPFYIFRDETEIDASKIKLTFEGDDSDVVLNNQESRFILADNDVKINYDWGTAFDTNDHMPTGIKMYVERHNDTSSFLSEDMSSSSSGTTQGYNLSFVDNEIKNSITGENFREYTVRFETPTFSGNHICDAVGNCISGEDVLKNLRVISAPVSLGKSTIQLQNNAVKMSANGLDSYQLDYKLRDVYNNSIRQVRYSGEKITDAEVDIIYNNELTSDLTNYLVDLHTIQAVGVSTDGNTIQSGNPNTGVTTMNFTENPINSEGNMEIQISSKVPTSGGYKYLKDSAKFEIETLNNSVTYHSTDVYKGNYVNFSNSIDFSTGTTWNYMSMPYKISEANDDTYNINIPSGYGKPDIQSNIMTGMNLLTLDTWKGKINFEFSSPILYHAEGFNTLRDGIYTDHTKKVEQIKPVTDYSIAERYIDLDNKEDIITPRNTRFFIHYNTTEDATYKGTTIYGPEIGGPSIINMWDYPEDIYMEGSAGAEVGVRYEVLDAADFSNWGYVSYIRYSIGGEDVYIPSISRGLIASGIPHKSSANFPNVDDDVTADINSLTKDIAINGLVNDVQGGATSGVEIQDGLVSLDMSHPYTRADLLERVNKKVSSASRGITWCSEANLNITAPDSDCTITIEGEQISFYDAGIHDSLDIDCGGSCMIDKRQSLIVKNGRINIISDINATGDGQLFIGSLSEKGITNVEISNDYLTLKKQKGWIGIHETVTNVDAFLLAEGSLVTIASPGNHVNLDFTDSSLLLNQLHIYGSLFSFNTIGGSKTGECPYIEEGTCTEWTPTSKIYDLSLLRRFALVDAEGFGGNSGALVPYSPTLDLTGGQISDARSSGGYAYYDDGTQTTGNGSIRYAPLTDEQKQSPVIIQRDHRWTIIPSYFSKD